MYICVSKFTLLTWVSLCLQTPSTPEKWKRVADGFKTRWHFPNCLGAIDGKHIAITAPAGSGSYYYNYKGNYSVVLLAICDANSDFIYVDIGRNGRVSDGGVWDMSDMNVCIENGNAGLPPDSKLPGSERELPYVFVADDAFPLNHHILKPFPHSNQNRSERIFSYRLSRARRTIENAFGILANRFSVFLTPILLPPEKVDKIVLACTTLHNYQRRDHVSTYTQHDGPLECEDISLRTVALGGWKHNQQLRGLQRVGGNGTVEGRNVRNAYMQYFNQEGAVAWQDSWTL